MKRTTCGMAVLVVQLAVVLIHKKAAQPAHAADRMIENSLCAGLGFASFPFLLSALYHPAAADARSVSRHFSEGMKKDVCFDKTGQRAKQKR